MKELLKDEFESTKVEKEVVASIQKKKEHKLIAQQRIVKGHLLFKFNPQTLELSRDIKYKKTDLVMNNFFDFDLESIRVNVEVENGFEYFQALNVENAIKKLIKQGYKKEMIKIAQLWKKYLN